MRCKRHEGMTIDECVGCVIAKNGELAKELTGAEAERDEWRDAVHKIAAAVYPGDRRVTYDTESLAREVERAWADRIELRSQRAAAEAENERLLGQIAEYLNSPSGEADAQLAAANAQLDEWREYVREAMEGRCGHDDEQHCSCYPILMKANEGLRAMIAANGECDDCPVDAELKKVLGGNAALRAENERLREAIGLATTAVPSMVMDADNPLDMMRRVVAEAGWHRVNYRTPDNKTGSIPALLARLAAAEAVIEAFLADMDVRDAAPAALIQRADDLLATAPEPKPCEGCKAVREWAEEMHDPIVLNATHEMREHCVNEVLFALDAATPDPDPSETGGSDV